jgi:flagellar biosynthetic protein FliR
MYFMLTLVIFLAVGGHHAMLLGLRDSFDAVPLLRLGVDAPLFDTLTDFLQVSMKLALRLAAPMLVTMLVVDLTLGLVGRIMPQMNVMAMGMSLRSALGLIVVILGLAMTCSALGGGVQEAMEMIRAHWVTG